MMDCIDTVLDLIDNVVFVWYTTQSLRQLCCQGGLDDGGGD